MSVGLVRFLLPALNHVLASESWAQERLRAHRGAHFRVDAGPLAIALAIDHEGRFAAAEEGAAPEVVLTLPADAPLKLILDRDSLFSSVKLSGAADIAETLAFVFRNLHWDVEADLASLVGDIAARRLVRFGRSLGQSLQAAVRNGVANIAEYGVEEARLLTPRRDAVAFGEDLRKLQDGLGALERRVALLAR